MGRPKGSTNERIWADTLRKIGAEYAEGKAGPKKIELAARSLVAAAVAGDISAAKELGDRLDGKPKQTVDATVTTVPMAVEMPAKPRDADEWASQLARPN